MDEVLKFLKDNQIFYLATVDGNVPKVRPFGFVMSYESKLYFCTSNQKDVFKQLQANPHVEVSTTSKTGEWLRLKGEVVFNTNKQSKQAALTAAPMLSKMYTVDDAIFELFYLENAEATFRDMKGKNQTIKL